MRSSNQNSVAMISSRPIALQVALCAALLVSFALGGGGSRFGLANLAVQVTALIALGAFPSAARQFWQEAPVALRALILATILLPLLQILPLPEGLAAALPGREPAFEARQIAGVEGGMALSLFPLRTALAASALITPLAIILLAWPLRRHHLFNFGWLIVAMGIVTLIIGVLQLADTDGMFEFWPEGLSLGVLLGTFANRNTTGLFLVGALGFALLLPAPRADKAIALMRLAVAALLLTAIILTQSRTALVLSAIPLLLGVLRLAFAVPQSAGRAFPRRAAFITSAILLLGVAAIATAVVSAPGRLAETLNRFEQTDSDARRYIWDDALYAAGEYWPVGAGVGTFDDVFQIDESLENIATGRRAGRAHNDYIEAAIEGGAIGLGLIALWLAYVAWLSWLARRSPDRWAAWAGSSFLLAIALQSVTDYPLRNQTLLAMAAFALALLVQIAVRPQERVA